MLLCVFPFQMFNLKTGRKKKILGEFVKRILLLKLKKTFCANFLLNTSFTSRLKKPIIGGEKTVRPLTTVA